MKRFFALVRTGVSQAYTKLFPNTLKKRTWWPVFLVAVVVIALVGILPARAVELTGSGSILAWVADVASHLLLELAKLCIFLTIFFLRFFITLASYNNYIDVSVVKLGWVMVRDVANMFFIVGLLVIAFATILGFESYEWKHGIVKIVLMAILINFSNLIAQLVIDVAHIFTITFLNAVSATAGGNLITLFQFDKILGLVSGAPDALGATRDGAGLSIFAASVMAFLFALLAALTIGAYLLVMIARIVVLWALIILSPLAFMLYAVPKGEDYAHEWWSEFSKHVIVAPVMVFFLWLAFATFGTGQIISEIQSDPNVIRVDSSGEEQSVSLLEVTTWENMASFLLGIAFLWVGIKKTQDTGATGSGLIDSAVDFTKNVATIASGYAVGRWVVGKGKDTVGGVVGAVGQAAGDYGKLASGKIGASGFGQGVKKYSGYQFLKNSGIRREAALDRLEKYKHAKHHEIFERGGGIAGKLAPSFEKLAKAEEMAHHAAEKSKTELDQATLKVRLELFKHEQDEFNKNKEKMLNAGFGGFDVDQRLREQIKKDFDDKVKSGDMTEAENTEAARADELKKRQAALTNEANAAERIEAKEKLLQLSDDQANTINQKAAKNLEAFEAKMMQMDNADKEEEIKGAMAGQFDAMNLTRLKKQEGEMNKAFQESLKKAIDKKAQDVGVRDEVSKRLAQRYADGEVNRMVKKMAQTRNITEDEARKRLGKGLDVTRREKAEEFLKRTDLDQQVRDEVSRTMDDTEKARVYDEVLTGSGAQKWNKLQSMRSVRSGERKTNKYKSEIERISLGVSDVLRGAEGKIMDQVRNWERSKIGEETKAMLEWSYTERMDEMKRNARKIKLLGEKELNKTITGAEADDLKYTRQRQMSTISAIKSAGESGSFAHEFRAFARDELGDSSYLSVENDDVGSDILMMGALSGRSADVLRDDKNFSKEQERLRKGLSEKHGILFRGLMKATQDSAEKKGNIHEFGTMVEGVDYNGEKKIGFQRTMRAGVGDQKGGLSLGTGLADQSGATKRREEIKGFMFPGFKFSSSDDGRAFVVTDEQNKGKRFQNEAAEKAFLSMVNLSAQQLNEVSAAKFNMMSGGGYDTSSYDPSAKKFNIPDIKDKDGKGSLFQGWSKLIKTYVDKHNKAGSAAQRDNVISQVRVLYAKMGVPDALDIPKEDILQIAKNSGLIEKTAEFKKEPEKKPKPGAASPPPAAGGTTS